jgi:predicted dithiol-disulfide oxidoreductase (DUF899 family)
VELPQIVSPEQWQAAHEALLAREKAATRARDALAAERRRQPMVRFGTDHVFEGADGEVGLLDLFEGRRQLIVYHFMQEPGKAPCGGCTTFTDNLGHPSYLNARDTTLALVSRAPFEELEAFRRQMRWPQPRYSSKGNTFEAEAGIGRGFGLSVFLRDGDDAFRTYFTSGRGVETLGTSWELLDVTPLGRQETWEDSPAGRPQRPTYSDWGMREEYVSAVGAG